MRGSVFVMGAVATLLAAAFSLGLVSAVQDSSSPADTVQAKRFVVVDDAGRAVGEFGYDDRYVRLRIPAKRGKPGVAVGVRDDGPIGFALFDENGAPVAELALQTKDSPPILWLGDGDSGRPKALLFSEADGKPGLIFFNEDGKPLWQEP